jgi:hypothetical protein
MSNQILMKMLFGQSFFQSFWPTKTNGILGISLQGIGGFSW